MKVFISTSSFGVIDKTPLDMLSEHGLEYELNPLKRTLTQDEILFFLGNGNYQGIIAGVEPLNEIVLSKASNLKVISRVGVGLDNVDLATARKLGIKVYTTPGALIDSVAELTVGLILNALRKISFQDKELKDGVWKKRMGSLLKGKKVGIIGCGRIGMRVAEILNFMGADIMVCDVRKILSPFPQVVLEYLIRQADIITLHASRGKSILTKEKISQLKRGVIIVNTARGELIDEDALVQALKDGQVSWACLDVFRKEPYQGPLRKLDNVTLTPHIGSYAKEARSQMEVEAVRNLLKGLGLEN